MVDPQQMRETLRLWPSGVSVVTTIGPKGRSGMTVSAFNSLSLDPPQILVCLSKDSMTGNLIRETAIFGVSFLGEQASELSDRFAGRRDGSQLDQRFAGVQTFSAATGSPLIVGATGWLDCEVATEYDGSSHWIVIGRVVAAGQGGSTQPLLYYDRAYHSLGGAAPQASTPP